MNKNKNIVVFSGGCVFLGIVIGIKCFIVVVCVLVIY